MLNTNPYLIGTVGLGSIVLCALYFVRKDLRRVMIYGGVLYLLYLAACYYFVKVLSSDPAKFINPGYWTPPSLFDLNRKTGGYGIEDVLFSFFAGAIAAGLYEIVFKLKVSKRANKKLKKGHALLFALIVGSLVYEFTPLNAIYFFIFLQLAGAIYIVAQRKDLLLNALLGGLLFMLLYVFLFSIFKFLFPHFLADNYHLQRTSHVSILGIALEEYLYAFTLGMMWAPIYEYEHRVKDSNF